METETEKLILTLMELKERYLELLEEFNALKNPIIKKDINGKPIRKGDKFRFKFIKEPNNHVELIGSFDWHSDELRYEIDIYDDDEYVCLSYDGYGIMYDFELCS